MVLKNKNNHNHNYINTYTNTSIYSHNIINIFIYVLCFILILLYSTYAYSLDWEQKFTESFSSSSNYTSLYLMVSSSGYSNVGHVAIYINNSTQSGKVEKVEANSNNISISEPLSKSSVNYIKSFFSSKDSLEAFPYKSFGGINFKYLHLEKKDSSLQKYSIIKRLNIKNPDGFKDKPDTSEYISLKNFFYDMSFLRK